MPGNTACLAGVEQSLKRGETSFDELISLIGLEQPDGEMKKSLSVLHKCLESLCCDVLLSFGVTIL